MGDVSCSSDTMDSLQDCSFSTNPTDCNHTLDVGLNCSYCSIFLCDDGECVDSFPCDGKTLCKDKSDDDDAICSK